MATAQVQGWRICLGMVLCWGLVGCSVDSKGDILTPAPGPSGKFDAADGITVKGSLEFGGIAAGELVRDLQFDGFTFSARAGAVVSVATMRLGTARALDNTLFIFGPHRSATGWGSAHLYFDDDSGWGAQAAIKDVVLPETGQYLIVMGSPNGMGRGNYQLELLCAEGPCAQEATECPTDLYDLLTECYLEEESFEGTTCKASYVESCVSRDAIDDLMSAACTNTPDSDPAWCSHSSDTLLVDTIPACANQLEEEHSIATHTLVQGVVSSEVEAAVVAAVAQSENTLSMEIRSFSYTGDPAGGDLQAVVDTLICYDYLATDSWTEVERPSLESAFDEIHLSELIELAQQQVGDNNFAAVQLYIWADAYSESDMYILDFSDSSEIIALTVDRSL